MSRKPVNWAMALAVASIVAPYVLAVVLIVRAF